MTTDTVMAIFSCTKAVTGVAVMQLVEEGKISLHDAAKKYVPEIADTMVLEGFDAHGAPKVRPPKSDITVSQLLLHTAGFGYDFLTTTWSNTVRRKYAQRSHCQLGVPAFCADAPPRNRMGIW